MRARDGEYHVHIGNGSNLIGLKWDAKHYGTTHDLGIMCHYAYDANMINQEQFHIPGYSSTFK